MSTADWCSIYRLRRHWSTLLKSSSAGTAGSARNTTTCMYLSTVRYISTDCTFWH